MFASKMVIIVFSTALAVVVVSVCSWSRYRSFVAWRFRSLIRFCYYYVCLLRDMQEHKIVMILTILIVLFPTLVANGVRTYTFVVVVA
jgi:hypothetical protein